MDRNRKLKRYTISGGQNSGSYRINDERKKKRRSRIRLLRIFLILAAVLLIAVYAFFHFFGNKGRSTVGRITKIGATISQNIAPFGEKVLFYDGTTIHCVSATGYNEWSYQIGTNADFDATDDKVVAWSGNDLYILNSSGRLIYNNKMTDSIQFASAGREYSAAFIGTADTGVVAVIDSTGKLVDNITVENQTLLDIGFFEATSSSSAQTTEYMWMLGLDTTGTVISTELQTFQPGRLSTGKTSLGEYIAYKIFDNNSILNIVTTREILHYSYRAIESESSTLIYGYTLQDYKKIGNILYQLLVPAREQSGSATINNVRIMYGSVDRMIHLPGHCLTAYLGTRAVYGFSEDTVYACRYGDTSFTAYPMPITVSNVLGMLSDNRAIVASRSEIYIVELPM